MMVFMMCFTHVILDGCRTEVLGVVRCNGLQAVGWCNSIYPGMVLELVETTKAFGVDNYGRTDYACTIFLVNQ